MKNARYRAIEDSSLNESEKSKKEYTTEDAIDHIGYGRYQITVGLVASLTWIADSMEVNVMGILGPVLKCEWILEDYQIALYSSIVFISIALFSPFIGLLSDKYGRRTILSVFLLIGVYFGVLSAFSPLYSWLIIIRFILGAVLGSLPVSTVYASEFFPKKNRGIFLSYATIVSWGVGSLLEVLLAFVLLNRFGWRVWIVASSIPFLFTAILVISNRNTPRFSLVSGNWKEAKETLQLIAEVNKSTLPEGELVRSVPVSTSRPLLDRVKDLFGTEYRMTSILTMIYGFLVQFSYYGAVIASTNLISKTGSSSILKVSQEEYSCPLNCRKLSQNDLGDLALTAFAEFLGTVVFCSLLEKLGRKVILSLPMIVLGLTVTFMAIIPTNRTLLIICLFATRFFAITPSSTIFIYCSEVYPTSFRATGVSASFLCGRVGAAISPFISQLLINSHPSLGLGVFSVVAFGAAITAALLPIETKGRNMED